MPSVSSARVAAIGGLRAARARSGTAADVPERLGDFELGERLGGGGMGVVHRARQVSLGRDVALKLVRPEQLWFEGGIDEGALLDPTAHAVTFPLIVDETTGAVIVAGDLAPGSSYQLVVEVRAVSGGAAGSGMVTVNVGALVSAASDEYVIRAGQTVETDVASGVLANDSRSTEATVVATPERVRP